MNAARKPSANLVAVLTTLGHLSLGSCSSCAFGFASFSDNRSYVPTWTVPVGEPYGIGDEVINDGNPFVLYDDTAAEIACSGSASQYRVDSDTWETDVTFPAAPGVDTEEFPLGDMFYANESFLMVTPPAASSAVAYSDSLYGRTVQLDITCERADGSEVELTSDQGDSCVRFEVNFTNYSPLPDSDLALYRFEDPAIPGFVLPPANTALNTSPGDIQLNYGNPIVDRNGSDVPWGCNGDLADYLGEDGEWYSYYTGSDGSLYNLTHVFYATNTTHLNVATIQRAWSPNMEAALYNRTVRLLISCTNINDYEEGYLFFKTGDESFIETCETFPELCVLRESDANEASVAATSTLVSVIGASLWLFGMWISSGLF